MEIISSLTVYDVGSDKLRFGNNSDGGYIVNQILINESSKLITLGYGSDGSFEIDWYEETRTPIDIYDGTCECKDICDRYPELLGSKINYYQQNIGNHAGQIPLTSILENSPNNTLLKVDIEGGEYNVFDTLDLSRCTGIFIEFHNLNSITNRNKLISLMQTEFSPFLLFHIHANNWSGTFRLDDTNIDFPNTIEISLINKKFVHNSTVDLNSYPITGLDYPNRHGVQEIQLSWVNSHLK